MTKQVTGFDLSKVAEYREQVTIGLSENGGETVTLPLIKLKDSYIAEIFISRLDALTAEWASITAAYQNRLAQYAKIKKESENLPDQEMQKADEFYRGLQEITSSIQEAQERQSGVIRKVRKITGEITEFLKQYLTGTGVLERLEECDDAMTHKVLHAMLYGTSALALSDDATAESEDDVKKN